MKDENRNIQVEIIDEQVAEMLASNVNEMKEWMEYLNNDVDDLLDSEVISKKEAKERVEESIKELNDFLDALDLALKIVNTIL